MFKTLLKKVRKEIKRTIKKLKIFSINIKTPFQIKTIVLAVTTGDEKNSLDHLKGLYFGVNHKKAKTICSILDLNRWEDYTAYFKTVKRQKYKSSIYPFNKSMKNGFYSHQCRFENFIPDIIAVNHSKKIRQGREMLPGYKRSVEDFGGSPKQFLPLKAIENPKRFRIMFGVFKKVDGYTQGAVVTNEKLAGYISFIRDGSICLYSQILGHAEYLNMGTMYNLHFHIMQWLYERNEFTSGIDYVMYGGHFQGGEGLRQWKENLLFVPVYIML